VLIDGSRILGNLFQGGIPVEGTHLCKAGFDVLVLAAEEVQPEDWKFPGVHVLRLPMKDEPKLLTPRQVKLLRSLSREVAWHLERGHRVLVTCRAGLNRSGLIVASTLLRTTTMSPTQVIRLIRQKRSPIALNNPAFVHAIVTEMRHDHGRIAS
jgi:protein-tyrosine phosphatase